MLFSEINSGFNFEALFIPVFMKPYDVNMVVF